MKKTLLLIFLIFLLLLTSGCFKRDDLENVTIYTTVYPIEYLVNELYGYNSLVKSIYPDDVDASTYKLTKKQIRDYSKASLFVYNGLSDEKKIAADFINANNNIKIIDVSQGLEINNSVEELWVSPVNYLMMAQNIRNSLKEYITNLYIKEEIDNNYEKLKISISEIDAELKIILENSNEKTIVVGNGLFKFLEKYGFDVINLQDEEHLTNITLKKVNNLISDGSTSCIFVKEGQKLNETITKLKMDTKVEICNITSGTLLTDEQRKNNVTYLDILRENVERIKKEMYDK